MKEIDDRTHRGTHMIKNNYVMEVQKKLEISSRADFWNSRIIGKKQLINSAVTEDIRDNYFNRIR